MTKQEREQEKNSRVFETFKISSKLDCQRIIRKGFEDNPDILFQYDGKRIGMELTEYFHSDDLREDQSIKSKIIERARNEFQKRTEKSIHATLPFRNEWSILALSKMEKMKEINKIVECSVQFVIENYDDSRYGYGTDHAYKQLEKHHLENVFYTPYFYDLPSNGWSFGRSAWSRDVSEAEVKEINKDIEKKNPKYVQYKMKETLDQCWLLIHSDANEISQMDFQVESIEWIKNEIIPSPFERIYFLDYPEKRVVKLK